MNPTPSIPARALTIASLLLAFATAPAFAKVDVEIWTDRGDDAVYQTGDAMHLKVRTTEDAWLLVYELDTEGNVNLLYPLVRGSTGRIEGRKTFHLPEDVTQDQLVVENLTGQGFLVAIASTGPFRDLPWYLRPFDPQAASMGYAEDPEVKARDEEGFDENGRAVGDPYVVMERIRRRVLATPEDLESFGTAYTTYYVHEQVRYPRYVCNDCHRPGSWSWWSGFDPYYTHCSVVDFRVNWGWAWGPQIWTAYVPYYYYIVRTDCPPMYRSWATTSWRFSSWDGRVRWANLWGGQLRRFKPATAPTGYTPPPQTGKQWKGGVTPPGYVPPDVRRDAGVRPVSWLQRDRGDGKPVWRAPGTPGTTVDKPRFRPDGGGISQPRQGSADAGRIRWRDWSSRGRNEPSSPGGGRDGGRPAFRPSGDSPRAPDNGQGGEAERGRPAWRPSGDSPPRNDQPQRQDPPRGEPVYKQPAPPPEPAHRAPPQSKPDFSRGGQGARPAGSGKGR